MRVRAVVLRVVVREGRSRDMADLLFSDLAKVVAELDSAISDRPRKAGTHFHH
jgi:hypothetical protein